jgi:circadian clock protein KaiB
MSGVSRDKLTEKIIISLYVTGDSASSQRALVNVRRICDHGINGEYELNVIDVLQSPHQAEQMRILATPTLVRESPLPARRVIGDLSDMEKVFEALELDEANLGLEGR